MSQYAMYRDILGQAATVLQHSRRPSDVFRLIRRIFHGTAGKFPSRNRKHTPVLTYHSSNTRDSLVFRIQVIE